MMVEGVGSASTVVAVKHTMPRIEHTPVIMLIADLM
jgi:hypothetical protein